MAKRLTRKGREKTQQLRYAVYMAAVEAFRHGDELRYLQSVIERAQEHYKDKRMLRLMKEFNDRTGDWAGRGVGEDFGCAIEAL